MKEIKLSGKKGEGMVALVDDADFDLVNQYVWHLDSNNKKSPHIRVRDQLMENESYCIVLLLAQLIRDLK